jgi:hypothetical protein
MCADVAIDLLLGRADQDTGGGGTHLNVDLATLAEPSNTPGELAGYGPVIADIARQAAQDLSGTEWTYSVTDEGGEVVATGFTRRRPTASQRRSVEARFQTCASPGCRMPGYDCDLDHRKPFSEGGRTHEDNLGPLCRHHHMAKHHASWHQERLPDGNHLWMSPLDTTTSPQDGHRESQSVLVTAHCHPGEELLRDFDQLAGCEIEDEFLIAL